MSPQALAEASPAVVDAVQDPVPPGRPPWVLALTSAVLLWFAFVPADWSWLAWGALVPLFLLIRSPRSRVSIYLGAWAGGLLFWLLSIQWVRLTDPDAWFAWLVMGTVLSFWWPGFLVLARLAVRRFHIPLMVAAPVIWVGLEYVRAHILTGFPWYYLAHTQHRSLPLIQIADVTGALGISVLIAMVNAWVVDLMTLPLLRSTAQGRVRLTRPQFVRTFIVAASLAATAGYGGFRIATASFRDGPRISLLQTNIEQKRKMGRDTDQLLMIYQELVTRAARANPKPDLIVWPETSYPKPFILHDPRLPDASFAAQGKLLAPNQDLDYWKGWEQASLSLLHGWTDQLNVPMLVGTLIYDFEPGGPFKFNSSVLLQPGQRTLQRYAKIHLVPFGEYVPFINTLPWLSTLTPYDAGSVPSLTFGREATWFTLGRYRFATAICFEDTIPQAVRRFFQVPRGARSPDVLINLSNDGWFLGSSELDMHLAISVFRAVENRVPIARSVNTGMTSLIDGNGRVLRALPQLTDGVLSAVVPLDDRDSLYSACGDWLGIVCLALTVGLVPAGLSHTFLRRQPS